MNLDVPVIKNNNYIVDITDIGNEGEGIGKINNFTVFVKDALPNEQVEIKIVKVKKSFAYGKLIKILKSSENRIKPLCRYVKNCGGCQLAHLDYNSQINIKTKMVIDSIERIGGIKNPNVSTAVGMEQPYYYRNKAQFPVRGIKGNVQIGFYAPRSHNITDIESCMLQNKVNDNIIKIVRDFLNENNIEPYDEINHKGLVRHVLTRVGFITNEIMVCIIINGNVLPKSEVLIERLKNISGMTSIVINKNKLKTNVILGKETKVLWGKPFITDYIGDIKFEISPVSFFQVNPLQTKILYDTVVNMAELSKNETVLDIYCGIGTISLFIANYVKKVLGIEVVEQAVEDAKRNAEINNVKNVDFKSGLAENIIPQIYEDGFCADVVIVDPPRKGCEDAVLKTIINMNPKKLIYISCNPSTLARDLKYLCENGFLIDKIQPVDQFCFTTHVETVVKMHT